MLLNCCYKGNAARVDRPVPLSVHDSIIKFHFRGGQNSRENAVDLLKGSAQQLTLYILDALQQNNMCRHNILFLARIHMDLRGSIRILV